MDLIIIFTPLQFINAVAYRDQFNKNCEFLVLTTDKRNISQICLLDKENICNFPIKNFLFLNQEFLWFIKIIYALLFIRTKKYSSIIIGNYYNIVGFCLAYKFQKVKKDITVIDDGAVTVTIYVERNENDILRPSKIFGGFITFILRYSGILHRKYLNNISFYTSFDLENICLSKYDTIIKQSFLLNNKNKKYSNELWFIGSPLIENKLMDRNTFNDTIIQVVNYAESKDLKFKYILHRFENDKVDLNCMQFDSPIEVILDQTDTIPNEVVSFYSSAIINIASMYPYIKCFYINLFKNDHVRYQYTKTLYNVFENHSNLHELIELQRDNDFIFPKCD